MPFASGARNMPINFTIANRTLYDSLPTPMWNLKLTQLECAPEMASRKARTYAVSSDAKVVAPFGCLQYHTNRSGLIETFNMGFGPYMGGLSYAICFKRTPQDSRVQ